MQNVQSTHTQGKHDFHDLYNAPDACHYMREMFKVRYEIGEHTAKIALNAMGQLLPPSSIGSSEPVVLELCAGYGLSMAQVRTTHPRSAVLEHYLPERRGSIDDLIANDRAFFESAAREGLSNLSIVGVDVAENALSYGKEVGFFDEVICRNLEDGKTVLSPAEGALCARARLVLATGALSYITPATLSKVSAHWETAPVFLFFPLVATDVTGVVAFFKAQGLEVFYYPSQYWLPQRCFADAAEAAVIEEAERGVLLRSRARKKEEEELGTPLLPAAGAAAAAAAGAERGGGDAPPRRPRGAKEGYVHATPLVAGPPRIFIRGSEFDFATVVPQWLDIYPPPDLPPCGLF